MLDCKRPEFDICEYAIVSLSYLQSDVEPLDICKGLAYPVVNTIKSINNGWCFIEEPDISVYRSSPKFELKYFNMETNSTEKLSSNLGTYEWMKLILLMYHCMQVSRSGSKTFDWTLQLHQLGKSVYGIVDGIHSFDELARALHLTVARQKLYKELKQKETE